MAKRPTRYGMAFSTIRYFQQQAYTLNFYNGIRPAGLLRHYPADLPGAVLASASARQIARDAIGAAFVHSTDEMRNLLDYGTITAPAAPEAEAPAEHTIHLTDDGTMDTVLRCELCGEEMRYSAPEYDDTDEPITEAEAEARREEWIGEIIAEAEADHECDQESAGPQDGDLTTSDHKTFYQDGKIVLTDHTPIRGTWAYRDGAVLRHLGTFTDCESAVRAYMERAQYWPNCWFISDHGNAHLMDLRPGA